MGRSVALPMCSGTEWPGLVSGQWAEYAHASYYQCVRDAKYVCDVNFVSDVNHLCVWVGRGYGCVFGSVGVWVCGWYRGRGKGAGVSICRISLISKCLYMVPQEQHDQVHSFATTTDMLVLGLQSA